MFGIIEFNIDMGEKKDKISWKYEGVEKTFLEACLHEVTANGREGSSLKSLSWKNVAEKLKNEHNFIVDQKQMKNHYDYLKSKFSAFLKLKNKTGNYYNPSTNTFNLTKEEWELESKSNKNIESLRRTPLPFPDLCTQLFEGATSTGADSWGPSSTLPRPSQDSTQYSLNDFDDIDCTQKDSGVGEESSGQSKKRKRREMSKSKETSNSRLLEIGEDISKVAKIFVDKYASSDLGACMEKLEKLGWGKFDPRYTTAILLFGESAEKRAVWLTIDPHICETWVKGAGSHYGYV
ncbi:hypothetical protein L1887_06534 [Cichorium endivia]|nr:hypothetical protein L1887_06534 [Cichorium endivia]